MARNYNRRRRETIQGLRTAGNELLEGARSQSPAELGETLPTLSDGGDDMRERVKIARVDYFSRRV